MLFIDILVVILIVAITFNLYLYRFEYKKMICALWEKLSKNAFKNTHTQQEQINCCTDDKENVINIPPDNNANSSSTRFYKPKIVYKSSRKVKRNSGMKYRICASCGQIKSKKNVHK